MSTLRPLLDTRTISNPNDYLGFSLYESWGPAVNIEGQQNEEYRCGLSLLMASNAQRRLLRNEGGRVSLRLIAMAQETIRRDPCHTHFLVHTTTL